MRSPRIRLRTLILVVALVAIGLAEWRLWRRVESDYRYRMIVHRWERADGVPGLRETYCGAPFWPQFWRRALGLPWPGGCRCDCEDARRGTLAVDEGGARHLYRHAGSRPPTEDEAAGWWATTRSLKTLGLAVGGSPGG